MRKQKAQRGRSATPPRMTAAKAPLHLHRMPPRRHVARTGRPVRGAGR